MSSAEIIRISVAVVLAAVPAAIWSYIFYKKDPDKKILHLKTFIIGALFVTPLLVYKYLWQYFPWLNAFEYTHPFKDDVIGFNTFGAIPLDVVMTFMIVGVIEEVTKFWAVKVSNRQMATIDDVIEVFITAALGFAFIENILYFYNIIQGRGFDGLLYPFIFRSLFSTFAHVMFSGIFGYFYGMSLFATQEFADKDNAKRFSITRKFAQLIHLKKETVFHEEKFAEGLLIAITLHAFFDIFLEMGWTFLLVPYLTGGFILLNYLMEKKEDHKLYGYISSTRTNLKTEKEFSHLA